MINSTLNFNYFKNNSNKPLLKNWQIEYKSIFEKLFKKTYDFNESIKLLDDLIMPETESVVNNKFGNQIDPKDLSFINKSIFYQKMTRGIILIN